MASEAERAAGLANGEPPILQYFVNQHLPAELQSVSVLFHDLAVKLVKRVPSGPERSVALRKLLESRDAAVRGASL